MARLTADEVITLLGLQPLPGEGGFFAETYRPEIRLVDGRSAATAIYFLITPEAFSALHRLAGDELYHFYAGDPVELIVLHPSGRHEVQRLGADLANGERPQALVRGGCWQGSVLAAGGEWALIGTTMTPGFDPADFELGNREQLIESFPAAAEQIRRLTRTDL